MERSCCTVFPLPCGSSYVELNNLLSVWLGTHLACFPFMLLVRLLQAMSCPWAPMSLSRRAGRKPGFLQWCHPYVWNMNQSLSNLGWQVSCTFSLRSHVNSFLPSPHVPRWDQMPGLVLPDPLGKRCESCSCFPLGSFSLVFLFSLF